MLIALAELDPLQVTGLAAGALSGQPGRFVVSAGGVPVGGTAQFDLDLTSGRLWWDIDGTGDTAPVLLAQFTGGALPVEGDLWLV